MEKEKQKYKKSLTKSMQRLVIGVALVILAAASLLNGTASSRVISNMFSLASEQMISSMKATIEVVGGFEEYAGDMIRTWESIPPEIRENPHDPLYREYFDPYENGEYAARLSEALEKLEGGMTMGDLYLAAIDRESGRILYLLDPDGRIQAEHYPAGMWEQMTEEQVDALLPANGGSGYYSEYDETFGRMRVFGMRVLPDQPPYVFLGMYDLPMAAARISTMLYAAVYVILLGLVILVIVIGNCWRVCCRGGCLKH